MTHAWPAASPVVQGREDVKPLEEFPRELHLGFARGRWRLEITAGPDLKGEISSTSRETVEQIAEACAGWLRLREARVTADA